VRSFRTPLGLVSVAATARGLARIILPGPGFAGGSPARVPRPVLSGRAGTGGKTHGGTRPAVAHPIANGSKPAAEAIAARAEREIREYLAGRRRRFTVPLDLSGLSPFHRRVLQATRRIPYGRTATYGDLARRVGRPRAARAVGQAMARNPVPLVVPCHRVVAAGGGLGGFGGGLGGFSGGLALKRRLLALEGARGFAPNPNGDCPVATFG